MVFYFSCVLYLDGEVASARRTSFVVWEQQDGNMAVVRLDLVALVDVHVAFVILFIAALGNSWYLDDSCAICLSTLQGPSVRDGKKEGSRAFSVF